MREYRHFIEDDRVASGSGKAIESIDPATGEAWASFARGDAGDVDRAVQAAARSFDGGEWGEYTAVQRADCLNALADLLERRWPELVEAEVRDNGKRVTEVNAQFAGLHGWFRHFAAQMLEIETRPLPNAIEGVGSSMSFEPYGVVGVITPWNSPLMILAWKIGPALAAGNSVVIKPSELASASTLEFARLCAESPLPRGAVNVVTGLGHEAGEALVRHPLVRKISFTGSDIGGRKVAAAAADGVKPTTLELGGKSPQLLFADADLGNAVNGILSGIFLSNGQTCVAGSRLIVEDGVYDDVLEKIISRAEQLRAGDPFDPATEIAPLANRAHLDKVMSMIDDARAQGAVCVCGGERLFPPQRPNGFYLRPTVFTGVTPQMNLWREEVFGPVLAVTRFSGENEAIRLANDTDYGLAAGIWTADAARAQRIAAKIQAGTVYINHYRSVDPGSPIGGFKLSGYGRELGPDAVKDYLQVKTVWTGTAPCADPFPTT